MGGQVGPAVSGDRLDAGYQVSGRGGSRIDEGAVGRIQELRSKHRCVAPRVVPSEAYVRHRCLVEAISGREAQGGGQHVQLAR